MPLDDVLTEQEFLLLQEGDSRSFDKVYHAYFGLIQYVIQRCGVDQEARRELMQDTFLRLHTKAAEIKDRNSVKAWLVSCAKNLAIDHLRRHTLAARHEQNMALESEAEAELSRHNTQRELEIKLVGRLVQKLCDEEQDDTFKLYYVAGMKARNIAELRSEPISTVTNRISRQRKKFQEAFVKYLEQLDPEGGYGQ